MEKTESNLNQFNTSDFYMFQLGANTPFLNYINGCISDKGKLEMKVSLYEKEIMELKTKFQDKNFTPSNISIGSIPSLSNLELKWIRPSELDGETEIFPKNFLKEFEITDYSIHSIVSALKALIAKPDSLSRIYHSRDQNKREIYTFWLSIHGKMDFIEIDSLLPINSKTQKYLFSIGPAGLWLPFIEKALAKVFGNYEKLINSNPIQVLRVLTGIPIKTLGINNQKIEDLYVKISESLNKGRIYCKFRIFYFMQTKFTISSFQI